MLSTVPQTLDTVPLSDEEYQQKLTNFLSVNDTNEIADALIKRGIRPSKAAVLREIGLSDIDTVPFLQVVESLSAHRFVDNAAGVPLRNRDVVTDLARDLRIVVREQGIESNEPRNVRVDVQLQQPGQTLDEAYINATIAAVEAQLSALGVPQPLRNYITQFCSQQYLNDCIINYTLLQFKSLNLGNISLGNDNTKQIDLSAPAQPRLIVNTPYLIRNEGDEENYKLGMLKTQFKLSIENNLVKVEVEKNDFEMNPQLHPDIKAKLLAAIESKSDHNLLARIAIFNAFTHIDVAYEWPAEQGAVQLQAVFSKQTAQLRDLLLQDTDITNDLKPIIKALLVSSLPAIETLYASNDLTLAQRLVIHEALKLLINLTEETNTRLETNTPQSIMIQKEQIQRLIWQIQEISKQDSTANASLIVARNLVASNLIQIVNEVDFQKKLYAIKALQRSILKEPGNLQSTEIELMKQAVVHVRQLEAIYADQIPIFSAIFENLHNAFYSNPSQGVQTYSNQLAAIKNLEQLLTTINNETLKNTLQNICNLRKKANHLFIVTEEIDRLITGYPKQKDSLLAIQQNLKRLINTESTEEITLLVLQLKVELLAIPANESETLLKYFQRICEAKQTEIEQNTDRSVTSSQSAIVNTVGVSEETMYEIPITENFAVLAEALGLEKVKTQSHDDVFVIQSKNEAHNDFDFDVARNVLTVGALTEEQKLAAAQAYHQGFINGPLTLFAQSIRALPLEAGVAGIFPDATAAEGLTAEIRAAKGTYELIISQETFKYKRQRAKIPSQANMHRASELEEGIVYPGQVQLIYRQIDIEGKKQYQLVSVQADKAFRALLTQAKISRLVDDLSPSLTSDAIKNYSPEYQVTLAKIAEKVAVMTNSGESSETRSAALTDTSDLIQDLISQTKHTEASGKRLETLGKVIMSGACFFFAIPILGIVPAAVGLLLGRKCMDAGAKKQDQAQKQRKHIETVTNLIKPVCQAVLQELYPQASPVAVAVNVAASPEKSMQVASAATIAAAQPSPSSPSATIISSSHSQARPKISSGFEEMLIAAQENTEAGNQNRHFKSESGIVSASISGPQSMPSSIPAGYNEDQAAEQAMEKTAAVAAATSASDQRHIYDLTPKNVGNAGNCLFEAVAEHSASDRGEQIDTKKAGILLRKATIAYMKQYSAEYESFMEDDKNIIEYLADMKNPAIWGGEPEIAAMADMLNMAIVVITPGNKNDNIHNASAQGNGIIFLNYVNGNHYEALLSSSPEMALETFKKVSAAIVGSQRVDFSHRLPPKVRYMTTSKLADGTVAHIQANITKVDGLTTAAHANPPSVLSGAKSALVFEPPVAPHINSPIPSYS